MENLKIEKKPLNLMFLYILWNCAGVIGYSFVYLYFKNAGLSELELAATYLFWALSPLAVMAALSGRKAEYSKLALAGIFLIGISYLLIASLKPTIWLLALHNVLVGSTCFLFWVPFNILYFGQSEKKEAISSAVYFAVFPGLSVVLPLLASFFVQGFGYSAVFAATAIIYFSCAILAIRFEKRAMHYELEECRKELKGFKTLILIEGIYGGGMGVTLVLIPLIYFTKPEELGLFLSVSTAFSLVASLLISRVSDKNRKRKKYIGVFGSGLGISTIIAAMTSSASGWYLAASLRNFFSALFWPFTTSILMDNQRHMEKSMVGREFLLNLGRIIGMLTVIIFILFASIHFSLIALGAVLMAYPLIIELKKKHITVA